MLLVALLVVIGGALKSTTASRAYWRNIDRSFAALARVPVAASNGTGTKLATLPAALAKDSRATLQVELDTLVRSGDRAWQEAETCATPPPYGGAGADLAAALHDRALALGEVRTALDGLLGLEPLPVAGTGGAASGPVAERSLAPSGAANDLRRAGELLAQADRAYARARGALRRGPAHMVLPASEWKKATSAWGPARSASLVSAIDSDTSLRGVYLVGLASDDVALTPPPVPPAAAASGASEVPPTKVLVVTVLVVDKGNEPESRIEVEATAVTTSGRAARRTRRVSLPAGGSGAVEVKLGVLPGKTYSVTLSVKPPVPNSATATAGVEATDTFSVTVAPGTA